MPERRRLSTLPLGALRAFEAAARHGSFKAAATELAVTPAAISHQVKSLEAHLGLALFTRLNRGLRLTLAGARLTAVAEQSFGRLEDILQELTADRATAGSTTLTISAAPSFAAKWLVPRMHLFQAAQPKVDLRLQAGDPLADLTSGSGVDVALRYGAGEYGADIRAERLWPHGRMIAVCAPSLHASGALRHPPDILRHPLLCTASPATPQPKAKVAAGHDGWAAWLHAAGLQEDKRTAARGPTFGTSQLALEAAAAGRGFALVPAILVADDLAAGRLIQPFAISIPDAFAYWLVYAIRRADEPRIRAFIRWVREEAGATKIAPS